MYSNSNIVHSGGSSTFVNGDLVHNHGSKPGFERLESQVVVGALHNSGEVSDQPKCHPGTRVAILDHLMAWAAALTYTYPIIWLHGPAGAGKSAILRTIAQMLFEKNSLVASFFFFRSANGRNSSHNFIATIVYQLALAIPATRSHIEQAIERNPLIFSLSLWDQAQTLIIFPIVAVLNDPSFDGSRFPRIVIIDGLDECHDPNKQCEILNVLCRVLQDLPIPFAVLVASRPEHHIRGAFDLGDLNRHSSRVSLDDTYEPDADIKKFLLDRFTKIQELHPLRAYLPIPWPSQEVTDKLVAKASGQFIYASTVDKFVSSIRHNPADRLHILLGILDAGNLKPFEQLDALYSTIFNTIDPVDLTGTLRVLGVLLVPSSWDAQGYSFFREPNAHSTRSARFLERLLQLAPGDVRHLLFDLESLLTIGGDDDAEIHFFHASLSDYLFDKSRSGQFSIDAGMIYADLAEQCLFHLSSSEAWEGQDFFLKGETLLFSAATPTPALHEAIRNCNLAKVVERYYGSSRSYDYRVRILQAIRHSKFSNAEELYRVQLAVYARTVRPKVLLYFQNTDARYSFIAATVGNLTSFEDPRSLKYIFRLSPGNVGYDQNLGFMFLSGKEDSELNLVMKDLLEDRKGEYFIDDNQYADIALYLMKCMTESSKSYVTPGRRPDVHVNIQTSMAFLFPTILSQSSIRDDLIECIQTTSISPSYQFSSIGDAITSYCSRSEPHVKNNPKSLSYGRSEPESSSHRVTEANQVSGSTAEDSFGFGTQNHPSVEGLNGKKSATRILESQSHEMPGRESTLGGESRKADQSSQSMSVPAHKTPSSRAQVPKNRPSHLSQSVTIPLNQRASSSTLDSQSPRPKTPTQRAAPNPLIKSPGIKKDGKTIESRSFNESTEPVPDCNNAALARTGAIRKLGDSSVVSSGMLKGRGAKQMTKAGLPNSVQKPSWK